jgi:hypothetical protein
MDPEPELPKMEPEGAKISKRASKVSRKPSRRRRKSILEASSMALKSAFDLNKSAVPLVASHKAAPGNLIVDWVENRAKQMASFARLGPAAAPADNPKVSMMALLSFSTRKERQLMLVGLVAAAISGLSMPTWLVLLGKSLETFNSIGKIVNTVGGEAALEILIDELYKLCWSFAVVGGVALFSGSLYVALWTYTGELDFFLNRSLRRIQYFLIVKLFLFMLKARNRLCASVRNSFVLPFARKVPGSICGAILRNYLLSLPTPSPGSMMPSVGKWRTPLPIF